MTDKITIISSVFGNLPIVKECMDSWFPLPENWELIVYNNDASKVDGTTEYVREMSKKHSFKLLEDGENRVHSKAIDLMLKHVTTEWVLHFDSDVLILNRDFYQWVKNAIQKKYTVWAVKEALDIGHRWKTEKQFKNNLRTSSKIQNLFVNYDEFYLPRIHQCVVLFNFEFLKMMDINFDNIAMVANCEYGPLLRHRQNKKIERDTKITIFGDTGWQLYWEADPLGLYCNIPEEIRNCFRHKFNSSCSWIHQNQKTLNELYPGHSYFF
jgi:hypothetical protein